MSLSEAYRWKVSQLPWDVQWAVPCAVLIIYLALLAARRMAEYRTMFGLNGFSEKVAWDAHIGSQQSALMEAIPYSLTKRAVLHKRWIMVTHKSRLPKRFDYITYAIADVSFMIIRGEDGELRAFHNVCRHRAYTVARKPKGNTSRLTCRYHGWQYDSTGALVKAPEFMNMPNFDQASNGLFEIHLRVDCNGFVFVNFATELFDGFEWSDNVLIPPLQTQSWAEAIEWELEVEVSWMIANTGRMQSGYWGRLSTRYFGTENKSQLYYVDDGSFLCHFGRGAVLLLSALPTDGTRTLIKCSFLTANTKPQPNDIRSNVDTEIIRGITAAKRYQSVTGSLDYRRSAVRERLDKVSRHISQHRALELAAGELISPSARVTASSCIDLEAEAICKALDGKEIICLKSKQKELEW
ncbi:Rieske [2Fe-2S] iron-sulfur domain-containing protein [Xylariales sp. PMI_506]|nr:Rieske [2Fe-2S] iron-sulfur domain-containing protein [Xylariales sp. PMI_506]